jgi:hypothetical protein
MGKSGGGSQQTTVQKSDPWSGVQPYITDYLSKASSQASQPYNFYNGDTIAGFTPTQQAGQQLATQRAMAGSPTLNSANNLATNTLNGNYLSPDSNPYLKQNVNTALNDVQTRVNSQFNGNNYGSTANQELLTRNLGDTAAQMYGNNYTNERNNQMQTMGQAPQLANADYNDANQLMNVGGQQQNQAQQYLTAGANAFNGANGYNQQQLDNYGRAVNLGMGGGNTTTATGPNPNQSNGMASALGGALSGAGLGSSLFGTGGALAGLGISSGLGTALGGGLGMLAFSDARLKDNIVKVGTHPIGVGVYDYNKFGHRERGVMAQEVAQVMPEAVTKHPSGYLQVNYGLLN